MTFRFFHAALFSCLMIVFVTTLSPGTAHAQDNGVFLREDFHDLGNWRPLLFPKISEHTKYSIEVVGDESFLKAESNASASGLVYRREFNVFEYPVMKWRWRISNVYRNGNALEKAGDDYPLRVYVVFKYDPEAASVGKRIKFGLAKTLYGEYPPDSTLTYIWESRKHDRRIVTSPYADEARMVILRAGPEHAGMWVEERVNIIDDYHAAFGEDPPSVASIAIMNDSDNTGESSVSYLDYIEVFR